MSTHYQSLPDLNPQGLDLFKHKNKLLWYQKISNTFTLPADKGTGQAPLLALDYFIADQHYLMMAHCYSDHDLSATAAKAKKVATGFEYKKERDLLNASRYYLMATRNKTQEQQAVQGLKNLLF